MLKRIVFIFKRSAIDLKHFVFFAKDINELIHNTAADTDKFILRTLCQFDQRQVVCMEIKQIVECEANPASSAADEDILRRWELYSRTHN